MMKDRKFRCIEEIYFLGIEDEREIVYVNEILTIEDIEKIQSESYFSGNEISIVKHFQEITPAEEILKELIEENIIELEEIKNQERTYGISIKHSKEDQSYFFDDDFNYLKQLLGEEE